MLPAAKPILPRIVVGVALAWWGAGLARADAISNIQAGYLAQGIVTDYDAYMLADFYGVHSGLGLAYSAVTQDSGWSGASAGLYRVAGRADRIHEGIESLPRLDPPQGAEALGQELLPEAVAAYTPRVPRQVSGVGLREGREHRQVRIRDQEKLDVVLEIAAARLGCGLPRCPRHALVPGSSLDLHADHSEARGAQLDADLGRGFPFVGQPPASGSGQHRLRGVSASVEDDMVELQASSFRPKAEGLDPTILMTLDRDVGLEIPRELHHVSYPDVIDDKSLRLARSRIPFELIRSGYASVSLAGSFRSKWASLKIAPFRQAWEESGWTRLTRPKIVPMSISKSTSRDLALPDELGNLSWVI
ncbi:hypothetical protein [Paludisphaera mucosa]|uniref:Uncharacterized protein n=1 Tax=Paludisphaera mucosa TaxID=3030827 RepID=A0ABT6FBY8_9BACT|nr:hypothetical protein [Paludisphaera mucosa]MDG3004903.1 hypothetical protein [Paludisphaera mucosa]